MEEGIDYLVFQSFKTSISILPSLFDFQIRIRQVQHTSRMRLMCMYLLRMRVINMKLN